MENNNNKKTSRTNQKSVVKVVRPLTSDLERNITECFASAFAAAEKKVGYVGGGISEGQVESCMRVG